MVYLFFIFLINFFSFFSHPFHVSVCDLNYNAEAKSVEITHKVFLDDLENALTEKLGENIDLLKEGAKDEYNVLIANYLDENFNVFINGKKYKPKFLGSEIQADAIWCYQEIDAVEDFQRVTIKNTVLFELFEDQTNLVHIKKEKKLKSLRLYEENKKGEVVFK